MPVSAPRPPSSPALGAARALLAAGLAAALTGCVVVASGGGPAGPGGAGPRGGPGPVLSPRGTVLEPTVVQVGLSAAGTPVVTQEPVVVPAQSGPGRIVWRLPPGSGLAFPENGIVVEGEIVQPGAAELRRFADAGKPREYRVVLDKDQKVVSGCRRLSELEFACDNANRPGRFAYTVRLLRDGRPVEPLDPTIVNAP